MKPNKGVVTTFALMALLFTGCGDKGSELSSEVSEEMESITAEMETSRDLAEFIEEITEADGEELLEDAGLDVSFAPPGISFAPGPLERLVIPRVPFPPELMPGGMVDKENVELEFYDCGETRCRFQQGVIPYTFPTRHYLDAAEIDVELTYSSTFTEASGNLNLTPPYLPDNPGASGPAAYVSSVYSVVRDLRGETTQIVSEGTGTISENRSEPMREFAWTTTGFPDTVQICGDEELSPVSEEEYAYADLAYQVRETTRNYPDGITDYRHRNLARQEGLITGNSLHLHRNGNTIASALELDPGDTPRCPLDDSGTITVRRTFSLPDDLPEGVTVPVREEIVITRAGRTDTISSTLTLNTGEVLTRTLEREIISPADCAAWESESSRPTVVAVITGETYQGGTLDLTVTRDAIGLNIAGTRTHSDGSYTEIQLNRYRATVNTRLQAARYDEEGSLRARIELNLRARQGRGQVIIYGEDGGTDTLMLVFPCNGKGYWYPEGNPSNRHRLSLRKLFARL